MNKTHHTWWSVIINNTVNQLLCNWRVDHAKQITMHVVPKKHFLKISDEISMFSSTYWYQSQRGLKSSFLICWLFFAKCCKPWLQEKNKQQNYVSVYHTRYIVYIILYYLKINQTHLNNVSQMSIKYFKLECFLMSQQMRTINSQTLQYIHHLKRFLWRWKYTFCSRGGG